MRNTMPESDPLDMLGLTETHQQEKPPPRTTTQTPDSVPKLDLQVIDGNPESEPKPSPHRATELEALSSRKNMTMGIAMELQEEVRNAVDHLSGPPLRLTLSDFAEEAFREHLKRLRKKHNDNQPFPTRPAEQLKPGRRVA